MMATLELWLPWVGPSAAFSFFVVFVLSARARNNRAIRKMETILHILTNDGDFVFNSLEERTAVHSMVAAKDWDGTLTLLTREHRSLAPRGYPEKPVPDLPYPQHRAGSPTRPPPPPPGRRDSN